MWVYWKRRDLNWGREIAPFTQGRIWVMILAQMIAHVNTVEGDPELYRIYTRHDSPGHLVAFYLVTKMSFVTLLSNWDCWAAESKT